MSKIKVLSTFSLMMITVGSIVSVRNLPLMAIFGSKLTVFFFIGALFFLIPTALVSAELASAIAVEGGIYVWVKDAFGKSIGFLAIWLQWIGNVIWYPSLLSFLAGSFSYLMAPSFANNALFIYLTIVIAFSATSIINIFGMRSSAWFNNFCTLMGLFMPMLAIISLGVFWVVGGNPLQINLSLASMWPDFKDPSIYLSMTGVMISLSGIEITTVHAQDVSHPQKTYPKVLLYSVILILMILILGSLSIAVVIPAEKINLVAGVIQAFQLFLDNYHLQFLMPILAFMMLLGGMGSLSNWIIAPTMGLMVAAHDGCLPKFLQRTNRFGAPFYLLILQALLVYILASLFIFMPSVTASYWLLAALSSQLYMLMYLLMFMALVKLRLSKRLIRASFKIPGGLFGLGLVFIAGFLGMILTFFVSFKYPSQLDIGHVAHYQMIGLLLMIFTPTVIKMVVNYAKNRTPIIL